MFRKKHRLRAGYCALILAACLFGTACGSSLMNPVPYGLVTGAGGSSEDVVLTQISSGIETYADQKGTTMDSYAAMENSESGYAEAFKASENAGNLIVFAHGPNMEIPVYNAQRKYHDITYVLFDGEPRKDESGRVKIRKNTLSVTFRTEDLGFFAGYTAVRNGYRNLGFLAGEATDDNIGWKNGFIQGVDVAAQDLGLAPGEVQIHSELAGSEDLTPMRMSDVLRWTKNGTEIILVVGENLYQAAEMAAKNDGIKLISGGVDRTRASDVCLFSATANYMQATTYLLEMIESGELKTGAAITMGALEESVKIAGDTTALGMTSNVMTTLFTRFQREEVTVLHDSAPAAVVALTEYAPIETDSDVRNSE